MGKNVRHRPTKSRAYALVGGWLTVLAILFNTMGVPLHAAALASPASEQVEICTPSGIKRITISFSANDRIEPGQSNHGGCCQLCSSCPLCPGPASATLPPPLQGIGRAVALPEMAGWPRTMANVLTSISPEDAARPRAPPPSL